MSSNRSSFAGSSLLLSTCPLLRRIGLYRGFEFILSTISAPIAANSTVGFKSSLRYFSKSSSGIVSCVSYFVSCISSDSFSLYLILNIGYLIFGFFSAGWPNLPILNLLPKFNIGSTKEIFCVLMAPVSSTGLISKRAAITRYLVLGTLVNYITDYSLPELNPAFYLKQWVRNCSGFLAPHPI